MHCAAPIIKNAQSIDGTYFLCARSRIYSKKSLIQNNCCQNYIINMSQHLNIYGRGIIISANISNKREIIDRND